MLDCLNDCTTRLYTRCRDNLDMRNWISSGMIHAVGFIQESPLQSCRPTGDKMLSIGVLYFRLPDSPTAGVLARWL